MACHVPYLARGSILRLQALVNAEHAKMPGFLRARGWKPRIASYGIFVVASFGDGLADRAKKRPLIGNQRCHCFTQNSFGRTKC